MSRPVKHPSVTEVLAYGNPAVKFFTKEHALRGSLIHDICYCNVLLHGLGTEFCFLDWNKRNADSVSEQVEHMTELQTHYCKLANLEGYEGYVFSAEHLEPLLRKGAILQETRLYHEGLHPYCGKLDYFGFRTGETAPGIVDFKTSHAAYKEEWSIQLAAYWWLCKANGIEPQWAASVRIRKDGKEPILDVLVTKSNLDEYVNKFFKKLNKYTEDHNYA